MKNSSRVALSFDVGGTFTDFVVGLDSGEVIQRHKVLTSVQAPATAALHGWAELVETGTFYSHDVWPHN